MTYYAKDCYEVDYPTINGNVLVRVKMNLPRYITKTDTLDDPYKWVDIFNTTAELSSNTNNAHAMHFAGEIQITFSIKDKNNVPSAKEIIKELIEKTNEKYLKSVEEEKNRIIAEEEQTRKDGETEQRLRDQYGDKL